MNLCDAQIIKILSEPEEKYKKWWVDVQYNCYGQLGITTLMKDTKEEARAVSTGDVILL